MSLTASQYLKTLLMKSVVLTNVMLWTEVGPHLEDLHNSLSHYFPNDRYMMLQNQAWIKKTHSKYKTDQYSLIYCVWEVHRCGFRSYIATNLSETATCPVLVIYQRYPQLSEKAIKILLLFQPQICIKLDFIDLLQPKQHFVTDWIQKLIWESSCLLLSQSLKRFALKKKNLKKVDWV